MAAQPFTWRLLLRPPGTNHGDLTAGQAKQRHPQRLCQELVDLTLDIPEEVALPLCFLCLTEATIDVEDCAHEVGGSQQTVAILLVERDQAMIERGEVTLKELVGMEQSLGAALNDACNGFAHLTRIYWL